VLISTVFDFPSFAQLFLWLFSHLVTVEQLGCLIIPKCLGFFYLVGLCTGGVFYLEFMLRFGDTLAALFDSNGAAGACTRLQCLRGATGAMVRTAILLACCNMQARAPDGRIRT
jgi:hypothetical protein